MKKKLDQNKVELIYLFFNMLLINNDMTWSYYETV